jgi:hypothetical protein
MRKRNTAIKTKADPDGMARTIDQAIGKIQAQLNSDQLKPSVTDLVRLIQLRNELAGEHPVDITARWVDECEERPASDR